jgi:GH24 family phage-related lysozyme (muramidase)
MPQSQSKGPIAAQRDIRAYITDGESRVPYPYLDIKGNLTIGKGFKIETEDAFAQLNLEVLENGVLSAATQAQIRRAYRQMKTRFEALGGGTKNPPSGAFNRHAAEYETVTNIRMSAASMDAMLDREIATRTHKIRAQVGDAAWNKLTRAQQTAIIDIDYNTGSGGLAGFTRLKRAICNGDAQAMAHESLLYTDRATKKRNYQRLLRNYRALSGESTQDAMQGLALLLLAKGEALPPLWPEFQRVAVV